MQHEMEKSLKKSNFGDKAHHKNKFKINSLYNNSIIALEKQIEVLEKSIMDSKNIETVEKELKNKKFLNV